MNLLLSLLIIGSIQSDSLLRKEERRLLSLLRQKPQSSEILDTLAGLYKAMGYKKLALRYLLKILDASDATVATRQWAILRMLDLGAYKTVSRISEKIESTPLIQRLPMFYLSSIYTGLRVWKKADDDGSSFTELVTWVNANNYSPLWLALGIVHKEESVGEMLTLDDYALILNWFSDMSFYPYWGFFKVSSAQEVQEGVTLGGNISRINAMSLMLSASILRTKYTMELNLNSTLRRKFNIGFDLYHSSDSRNFYGFKVGFEAVYSGKLLSISGGMKSGGPGEYINPRVLVFYPEDLGLKTLFYLTMMLESVGVFQIDGGVTYELVSDGKSMTLWCGYSVFIKN